MKALSAYPLISRFTTYEVDGGAQQSTVPMDHLVRAIFQAHHSQYTMSSQYSAVSSRASTEV